MISRTVAYNHSGRPLIGFKQQQGQIPAAYKRRAVKSAVDVLYRHCLDFSLVICMNKDALVCGMLRTGMM